MGKLLSRSFLHKFMTLAVTLAVFAGTIFITTPAYADIWSRGSSYSGVGASSQRSSSSSSSSSRSSSSSSSSRSSSSSSSSRSSSSSSSSRSSSSSSSSRSSSSSSSSRSSSSSSSSSSRSSSSSSKSSSSSSTSKTTYTGSNGVTYDRPVAGYTRDTTTGQVSDSKGNKCNTTVTTTSGSSNGSSKTTNTTTTTMNSNGSSSTTNKTTTTTKTSSGSTSTSTSTTTNYNSQGKVTSSSTTTSKSNTNGNYTESSSKTTNYDRNGQVTSESSSRGSTVVMKDGSTYTDSYTASKTYNAAGKVTSHGSTMNLNSTTASSTGGDNANAYVLNIKNNADGTKESSSVKTTYDGDLNITTLFTTINQTRKDGTTITSELEDNWEGDIMNLVDKKGTSNKETANQLGAVVGYGPNGEQIRQAIGLDDQYLPFGSSEDSYKGTKSTYMDRGPNGEYIMRTIFTDENGERLIYDMVYDEDGTLVSQNINFQKDEKSGLEQVYNSDTWITGKSDASSYESVLGNFGLDYGKIEQQAASIQSGTAGKRVDDPASNGTELPEPEPDPNPEAGPDSPGYSSAYSITANVKSLAGTVSISDTSKAAATYGNSQTWTYDGQTVKTISIVADPGYRIKDVQINGVSQGAVSLISVASSEYGTLVNVWFEQISHKITADYGKHGMVTPSGLVKVWDGGSQTYNFIPDKDCSVAFAIVDGEMINNPGTSYTFNNVKEDHTLHVEFSDANATHFKFIYATSGEGGSLSLEGCIPVTPGLGQDIQITPDEGFEVDKIIVDGQVREAATHFRFEAVNENHTIHVTFKEKAPRTSFVVTASAGNGGSISPAGMTTVASGGSVTFTMTPNEGYMVGNVYVNGQSAGIMGELTLTNIFADQTVYATFINTSVNGSDLIITDISPDKVTAGMNAMSFARVMNLGNVAAQGVEVKLTVNGQTYTETITESIAPGSYYDVMFKWPAPLTAGVVTAEAQVNTNGAITESDISNNSFSKPITVAGMFPEAGDSEDPGVINPDAYTIPSDNPVADVTWEQNGELYRALAGIQVTPSAEGLKSGYGFETTAIVQIVTNSPHLSVDDLKVIARLPEFGYAKCKVLEEDITQRTDTTTDGVRTITCYYRFGVNSTSKVGARKWYVPVSWPDMYNYKLHTQVLGISTPAGYIELSQNSSILINSNMYTDDTLGRG